MLWLAKLMGVPLRVIAASNPAGDLTGKRTRNPLLGTLAPPTPGTTVKLKVFPLQTSEPNDELLRKSSQSSNCLLEMIGTLRGSAEANTASDSGIWGRSVCALMTKAP